MTEYDLIKDWTLHAGIDEEAAKRVLFRLKLEDGWQEFLEVDSLRGEIEDLEAEIIELKHKIEQLEENSDA